MITSAKALLWKEHAACIAHLLRPNSTDCPFFAAVHFKYTGSGFPGIMTLAIVPAARHTWSNPPARDFVFGGLRRIPLLSSTFSPSQLSGSEVSILAPASSSSSAFSPYLLCSTRLLFFLSQANFSRSLLPPRANLATRVLPGLWSSCLAQ